MLDLSGVLAPKEGRGIEAITQEILDAKRRGGEAILTIGRCLTEAKQALPHGEWLPWLNERVEFSERTARNFMRLSREWSNRQALADLGAAKALTLLALPAEERESFIAENHVVGGEEKTVIDMTSRELEKAIRERKEAQEAAAKAQAEASAAEQARAKMAEDMKLLNARLSGAQEDREQAAQAVARLEAQLAELKEKPVEVAVEPVVDQEALEKARAEAVAGMQDKLDQAREAKSGPRTNRKSPRRPWSRPGSSWRSRPVRRKRPPWGRTRIWPSSRCCLTRPKRRSTGCTGSSSRCGAGMRTPPVG